MDFLHIHFLYDPVTFLLDLIYDCQYCYKLTSSYIRIYLEINDNPKE